MSQNAFQIHSRRLRGRWRIQQILALGFGCQRYLPGIFPLGDASDKKGNTSDRL